LVPGPGSRNQPRHLLLERDGLPWRQRPRVRQARDFHDNMVIMTGAALIVSASVVVTSRAVW